MKKYFCLLLPILLVCILSLFACSSTPKGTAVLSQTSPGVAVFDLKAGNYYFEPEVLEVPAGKDFELRVHLESTLVPHRFVLVEEDGGILAETSLSDLTRIPLRIEKPGTYRFFCDVSLPLVASHRERGMEGKMIVQP